MLGRCCQSRAHLKANILSFSNISRGFCTDFQVLLFTCGVSDRTLFALRCGQRVKVTSDGSSPMTAPNCRPRGDRRLCLRRPVRARRFALSSQPLLAADYVAYFALPMISGNRAATSSQGAIRAWLCLLRGRVSRAPAP